MKKLKEIRLDKVIADVIRSFDVDEVAIRVIKRESKREPTRTYYPDGYNGKLLVTNDLGVVHYLISMSSGQEDEDRPYASVVFYDLDDLETQKFRDIYGGYTLWYAIDGDGYVDTFLDVK